MKDTAPTPTFPPSREAGLARMNAFLPRAGKVYAAERNHDRPGHENVSTLSPWLRHRAITEAEVAGAVTGRFAPSTAEKFLSEVLWRSYFKGHLERRPGLWTHYRQAVQAGRNRLATESGLRREWEAACEGRTGIAPFDDWAAELAATGYLHNHARMWFASIWIHTLGLPWALGADFFLRHLLDGDPASNTLSWRWVAGLHTSGKPYRARASNIAKYTDGRYDAAKLGHQLATEAPIPDAPPSPDPGPAPEGDALPAGRAALLLHEDDLHPDFLATRGFEPAAVAVLVAPRGRSPWEVASNVRDFTHALAEDAAARWNATGPVTDDAEEVARWAAGFDRIVAPYIPVGPLREAVRGAGLSPLQPLRDWDAAAWAVAQGGFFKVKSRMSQILEAIPADTGG